MFSTNNLFSAYQAKVHKAWLLCAFVAYTLNLQAQKPTSVQYNEAQGKIVFLAGLDTLAYIPLDKQFELILNHEKQSKKGKVRRWPMATYAKPYALAEIPIHISNTEPFLHLRGFLQGDTSLSFHLLFYTIQDGIRMELQSNEISVNQFSFELFPCPNKNMRIHSSNKPLRLRTKKNKINVSVYGLAPSFLLEITELGI